MVKEKKILSYFIGWLILGFCILFVGVNNVFAEEITPIEIKSQIRTIYTDGTTQWYTSGNNTYTTPLYFGTGPSYSTYGIPCNFRLMVIDNIDSSYSYKYSYDMHIFTPYSTNNTWDSSKIDSQYDIRVGDDQGVVKDSKCTIVNTTKNNNALGTFINKTISCVFTVNKSQTNTYISAGYFCKGNCNLTNMEPLGYIPQDSYMSIDNVKIEKFNDNSNIIIDQNQTIIDQNNTTNEKLDDVQQSIIGSNKETQDVIKDQFQTCRPSKNLWPLSTSYTTATGNEYVLRDTPITIKPGTYTISFKNSSNTKVLFNFKDISGTSKEVYFENTYQQTVSFSNEQVLTAIYIYDRPSTISEIQFQAGNSATKFEEPGKEICTNRIDETNDKLDSLQGALTDSSSPNTGALENSAGWLPAGPLDSILNLPLTMLNSLTNSLGKTCTPLNLTLPYVNKNIQIPCLSAIFEKITGVNGLWSWVGTIASVLILYNYLLNLYAWVDRILTLRAEFDEAMGADLANWGRL